VDIFSKNTEPNTTLGEGRDHDIFNIVAKIAYFQLCIQILFKPTLRQLLPLANSHFCLIVQAIGYFEAGLLSPFDHKALYLPLGCGSCLCKNCYTHPAIACDSTSG